MQNSKNDLEAERSCGGPMTILMTEKYKILGIFDQANSNKQDTGLISCNQT
jgi:hypothetical protein